MPFNWRKPLVHLLLVASRSSVPRELRFARSVERSSPAEVRDIQRHLLRRLLLHAWRETDYYREVLSDCRAVRNGKVDLERFDEIPVLTKDLLQSEGSRLKARALPDGRKAFLNRTGGSTGQPCEFWQDDYYDAVNVADKLYHFETFGKVVGELELKVWGSRRDLIRDSHGWVTGVKNFLYNRKVESCERLSENRILEIVAVINRFRPKLIWGYVDGLYAVSDYVVRNNTPLHSPAAVFCAGGTFYPHMERAIEQAFGCPAVNYYGSREMGAVACHCEKKEGLHVTSHSHLVEVVSEGGRPLLNEEGNIVITSLTNYAMPLLRYWTGDRGRMSAKTCPCGRGTPLLTSVSGRGMESFVKANGEIVSPIYLITSIGVGIEGGFVKKFQLVQEDYHLVTLKVVANPEVDRRAVEENLARVAEQIRKLLGEGCAVSVQFVDDIPHSPSGKYLSTVCRIWDSKVGVPGERRLAVYNSSGDSNLR